MKILGIESSCDETAIAVVEDGRKVLSSIVASQVDTHKVFGGVVPEIAAREHLKCIEELFHESLREAKLAPNELDAIGITQGPGLIGALLVGVSFAKGLAQGLDIPLVPVNHVHAHVHGALLETPFTDDEIFPCIAAVVSGGHTNLYIMNNPTDFQLVAYSIDDACGESFDKVAKRLGLKYPGGPEIEKLAKNGDPQKIKMPRMMEQKSKLMFSYSGLKTHMVNLHNQNSSELSGQLLHDVCAAFQEEALGQLVRKISIASSKWKVKSILIAGGVAANGRLKSLLGEAVEIPVIFPNLRYCSDNAAMIAALAFFEGKASAFEKYRNQDWDAFSRYQFADFLIPM